MGAVASAEKVTQSPSLIKRISAPGNEIEGDPSSRGRLSSYKRALARGALVIKVGKQRCCSFNCSLSCKLPRGCAQVMTEYINATFLLV